MAKQPARKPTGRRSPPLSLKPLKFGQVVDGLLATPPKPAVKPATKKPTAKRKPKK